MSLLFKIGLVSGILLLIFVVTSLRYKRARKKGTIKNIRFNIMEWHI